MTRQSSLIQPNHLENSTLVQVLATGRSRGCKPLSGYGDGLFLDTSQRLPTFSPSSIFAIVFAFGADAEHSTLEMMERPKPVERASSACVLCCFRRSDRMAGASGSPNARGRFSDGEPLGNLISTMVTPKDVRQRRHLPSTDRNCFSLQWTQVSIIGLSSRGAVCPGAATRGRTGRRRLWKECEAGETAAFRHRLKRAFVLGVVWFRQPARQVQDRRRRIGIE